MNTEAVLKLIMCTTKTHIDLHNGDLQIPSGVFKNDQSSLNYSLHYLITFKNSKTT